MGITTTLRLLKFSLSGIHLFAWPVIALGYPLFASIRAVENGSIYQMRKLVIYWILLSLFSLFEFSFLKILQWIPFWSSIRLVVIFWLVMPWFEGACILYHGLVRPVLLVKSQAVIYSFFNLKEERLCKRETCLGVVENFIEEYGLEALEKLIASEHESQNRIDFQRGAKIIEQEAENSAATSKQSISSSAHVRNGTNATTNVKETTPRKASAKNRRSETIPLKKNQQEWTCHLCDVTNASRSMLNAHLQGSKHKSKVESLKASLLDEVDTGPSPSHAQSVFAARDLKGTYVDAGVEGIMQPKETAENRSPEAPLLEKTQQEWSCDMCKVTTTTEITFNAHLQGRKHKSKLEITPNASILGGKDEGPSPSTTSKRNDGNVAAEKLIKESCELERLIASKTKCGECSSISSHGDAEENNGPVASQQHAQSVFAARDLKGTYVDAVVEGIMQPKETAENRSPEAPLLEKTQQEWSCDLCKVTTTSEITFNAHLQGRKHKSKLEITPNASILGGKDEGPSPSTTSKRNDGNVAAEELIKESCELERLIASKTKCGECSSSISSHGDTEENNGPVASQQHAQSVFAARDLKGTYVDVGVEGIMQPKETAENRSPEAPLLEKTQQEWSCDMCKVTTTSEITFNAHLQGRKHKSKLEITPNASILGGKDEGPSPSTTSKRNDGNVAAEELIKESCELERLIASKTKCGECSSISSHGDAEENNGPVASQQHAQSVFAARDLKGTYVDAGVEGIMQPKETAENRSPEAPLLEKTQQEWSCDMCKTKCGECSSISSHGDAEENNGPVASQQHAQSVSAARDLKGTYVDAVVEGIMQPKETAENRSPEAPLLEKTQQEWSCDLCKVTTTSEITFNGHLQGRKHKSKLEITLKESTLGGKDEGPSPSTTSKRNDGNVAAETRCGECSSSISSHGETEENNGPVASQQVLHTIAEVTQPRAETPTPTTEKWRCGLCKVEATSEKSLNDHLRGSKHKSNFESLKMSKLSAADTDTGGLSRPQTYKLNRSNLVVTKIKAGALNQYWCNVCGVKLRSYVSVEPHLKGKRHSSKMNLWEEVEATIPKNMPWMASV